MRGPANLLAYARWGIICIASSVASKLSTRVGEEPLNCLECSGFRLGFQWVGAWHTGAYPVLFRLLAGTEELVLHPNRMKESSRRTHMGDSSIEQQETR